MSRDASPGDPALARRAAAEAPGAPGASTLPAAAGSAAPEPQRHAAVEVVDYQTLNNTRLEFNNYTP